MTLFHPRPRPAADPADPVGRSTRWSLLGAPFARVAVAAVLAGAAWQLSAQSTSPGSLPAGSTSAASPAAQDSAVTSAERGASANGATTARLAVPFGPGERLTYDAYFGFIKVGTGVMEIGNDLATVRGQEAYHTRFRVRGGTFFYKVDDLFESWIDTRSLASLRFNLDQNEGKRDRERKYEIFPERQTYREGDKPEEPSVADPLDEGSFLYYVRTLPLKPGDVYEVNRYFRPDRNPVRIRVLRRERVTVPAGTFNAVVVQPTIRTRGIFSEGGRAEVWLSDDEDRVMLQMKSQLSFGSLNLFLRDKKDGRRLTP